MRTILFIVNTSYNLYNFRYPLLKALKKKGYKVVLSAPQDEYTYQLKEEFEFFPLKHIDRKGLNPLKDFLFLLELLKLLSNIKPSIVVNITIKPNIWGNLAAQILDIPSISIITGLGSVFTDRKFPLYQIVKTLYRIALKHPKRVIFQNPDDAKFFIEGKLVRPEKVKVILGSGVDLEYFKPSGKKKQSTIVFGYAGRFLWDKGIKELVEAVKILKKKNYSFKVYLLGKPDEGNPKSIPLEQIREWEKEKLITYKGFSKDVQPFLEEIDCFVYPSFYREGIPKAILEAMAMEKPIITTDTPGCKITVLKEFNGFLIPPKNSHALAKVMESFLNLNEEKRKELGVNSRKLAKEKFEIKKIVNEYISVVEDVLNIKI